MFRDGQKYGMDVANLLNKRQTSQSGEALFVTSVCLTRAEINCFLQFLFGYGWLQPKMPIIVKQFCAVKLINYLSHVSAELFGSGGCLPMAAASSSQQQQSWRWVWKTTTTASQGATIDDGDGKYLSWWCGALENCPFVRRFSMLRQNRK